MVLRASVAFVLQLNAALDLPGSDRMAQAAMVHHQAIMPTTWGMNHSAHHTLVWQRVYLSCHITPYYSVPITYLRVDSLSHWYSGTFQSKLFDTEVTALKRG